MAHIIIIGAGASGLMAASILLEKNHRVTIVEARDRVGGRIYTFNGNFSAPVDGGAEFIHGNQELTLSLVRQAGAKIIPVKGKQYYFEKGALRFHDPSEKQWEEFMDKLQQLQTDMTVASFLEMHFSDVRYNELNQQVKNFAAGFDLADISQASILSLREEWQESDDEHQYHIEGGYGILINYLRKKIEAANATLKLSTVVHQIQWEAGKVKVLAGDNEIIEAEQVIITVPLGVLKTGALQFSPPLIQHQSAFEAMGFGGVIKFLVEFHPDFWQNQIERKFNDVGFIFSDAAIPTWWSQRPSQLPLLTGWLGGPSVQDQTYTKPSLYKTAIDSLCYILQCSEIDIEKNIVRYECLDWTTDLYAQGAYAYATMQSEASLNLISTPVSNTIYFAGEAIYSGKAIGTVEAAFSSAQEVAAKVMRQ